MSVIEELLKRIKDLEIDRDELLKRTSNLIGSPIIQGYAQMKLNLNAGLDVIQLKKRIEDVAEASSSSASNTAVIEHEDTYNHENYNSAYAIAHQHSAVATDHAHSKLVASDGSPDPAISVDASGEITAAYNLKAPTAVIGDATNKTSFDATGHQTMSGTAKPWRDEQGNALILKSSGVGVELDNVEGTVDFVYNANYSATPASADYLITNIQLNHDKETQSVVNLHIHFFQEKNYIPNFLLAYRWQIELGEKTTAWTLLKCNNLAQAYSGTTKNNIAYAASITPPAGAELSDILQVRIYRDTDNTSTLFAGNCPYNTGGNASAKILFVDAHFQANSIGSTDEYTK